MFFCLYTVKTLTKLLFEQYDKNSEMENSPLGLKNGIEELNTENLIEVRTRNRIFYNIFDSKIVLFHYRLINRKWKIA